MRSRSRCSRAEQSFTVLINSAISSHAAESGREEAAQRLQQQPGREARGRAGGRREEGEEEGGEEKVYPMLCQMSRSLPHSPVEATAG